jgi:hypothetical protein
VVYRHGHWTYAHSNPRFIWRWVPGHHNRRGKWIPGSWHVVWRI